MPCVPLAVVLLYALALSAKELPVVIHGFHVRAADRRVRDYRAFVAENPNSDSTSRRRLISFAMMGAAVLATIVGVALLMKNLPLATQIAFLRRKMLSVGWE